MIIKLLRAAALLICTSSSFTAIASEFPAPLPADSTLKVETLPAKYPTGWAFLNYAGDRIELRNVGGDSREVKGAIAGARFGDPAGARQRGPRSTSPIRSGRAVCAVRGPTSSPFTIPQTMNLVDEIVLPGAKRALITAMEGLLAFTDDQRMALVFDFTPASSVTVVDLVKRQVLGEIEIPGCSLVYPSGNRGFSTLCSSGTLLTIRLDATARPRAAASPRPSIPSIRDPLFTASAASGGVRYFPSLHGRVQPIDMTSDDVKILPDWPLSTAAEQAEQWRPSGWQVIASDEQKLLYVLMQAACAGRDPQGSGQRGMGLSTLSSKSRVKRMRLVRPGSSISLTHAAEPLLLVQAGERLDVYDPLTRKPRA